MTRSKVIEAALMQHLEQGTSETLLAGLHQRFDTMTARQAEALAELTTVIQQRQVRIQAMNDRVDKLAAMLPGAQCIPLLRDLEATSALP